jgi:DNA repair protein RecN (Recombination protein N)
MAPAIEQALAHLHMAKTKFEVRFETLDKKEWAASGAERVQFYVQTNPGLPAAPLVDAASGGEVSRLMLALKQVLYADLPPQTLIFDEIDSGIGGAVAAAAGAALATLAQRHQVLVITHQPQVAAQGAQHLKIEKNAGDESTETSVKELCDGAREEELARMLAGREITAEARKAAQSLLKGVA